MIFQERTIFDMINLPYRIIFFSQCVVVNIIGHIRMNESAECQAVVPATAEIFYINFFISAEPLLTPFDECIALADAVLLDQVRQSIIGA